MCYYTDRSQKSDMGLTRLKQGVCRAVFLSGGSKRGSVTFLIQVVVRIQFIVVIGQRSPFLCWLSTKNHSQLLKTTCIHYLMAPFLHLQRQPLSMKFLSCFRSLLFLLPLPHLCDQLFLAPSSAFNLTCV